MESETNTTIVFTAGDLISCPSEVERIAQFVETWGRASEDHPAGCTHDLSEFCEQFGCTSFIELADDIRERFKIVL